MSTASLQMLKWDNPPKLSLPHISKQALNCHRASRDCLQLCENQLEQECCCVLLHTHGPWDQGKIRAVQANQPAHKMETHEGPSELQPYLCVVGSGNGWYSTEWCGQWILMWETRGNPWNQKSWRTAANAAQEALCVSFTSSWVFWQLGRLYPSTCRRWPARSLQHPQWVFHPVCPPGLPDPSHAPSLWSNGETGHSAHGQITSPTALTSHGVPRHSQT